MIEYKDRIPVEETYTKALGEVIYNYATAEWMIVYLGSLVDSSFVSQQSGADFDSVAKAFQDLSQGCRYPEFAGIAKRFTAATPRRQELEKSIPITAYGGVQELDQWSEDDVIAFAKELQELDIDANALYYRLRPLDPS